MAVVRFGPIVQAVRGTLGSCVFARQGGVAIVRQRPMKVNQESARQLEVRTHYSRAVALWSGLSQVNRDAWFRCAQVYRSTNPEGESRPMSAWLVFATVALRMLDTSLATETWWHVANPLCGNLENGTVRLDVWPGGPAQFVHSRGATPFPNFSAISIIYGLSVQRVFRTLPGWPGQSWKSVWHDASIGYSNNVSAGFAAMGGWPAIGERIRWRAVSHYPQWPGRTVMQGFSVVPNVGLELVVNGDMELPAPASSDPPTGWSVTGTGVLSRITTQPWGDVHSLKWTRAAAGGNTLLASGYDIVLTPGESHTLRFAARCVKGVPWAVIQYKTVADAAVNITAVAPAADGLWAEYEYDFTPAAGYTVCRLQLYCIDAAAMEVELDNVSVRRNL